MRTSWGRSGRKYNNTKVKFDGITFDSDAEMQRYLILTDRVRAGEIQDLIVRPGFWLEINGVKIVERRFHPDFAYRLAVCPGGELVVGARGGVTCVVDSLSFPNKLWMPGHDGLSSFEFCDACCVVEDVKGYMDPGDPATRIFDMKAKLMKAIYGIDVRIVQSVLAQRRQASKKKKKQTDRYLIGLTMKASKPSGM